MSALLVTGGAGYIGSVVVDLLLGRGERVVVLDDLSRGNRDAVNRRATFVSGSIGDDRLVRRLVSEFDVGAVLHFAGLIAVGESVADPATYLDVNVAQSIRMIEALHTARVDRLVFSSSAAVYGEPDHVPIAETHPTRPTSPYGWTKLAFEQALGFFDHAYRFRSVSLRYFNAAGSASGRRERHVPETHLIPNVLAAAAGDLPHVRVFGTDYPTPDGTPIRDYIHIADLAAAHLAALDYLADGGPTVAINLGNGTGYSVNEVIETARRVTGAGIPIRAEARRPGDPPRLVASAELARSLLGWEPSHTGLDDIIASAWAT